MRKCVLGLFIILLLGQVVYAKKVSKNIEQDRLPLNLINLLDIAMQRNNSVKLSYLNIDMTRNEVEITKSKFYPTITAEGSYGYAKNLSGEKEDYKDSNGKQASLRANYTVFAFGRNKNDLEQVKHRLNSINYTKDSTIKDLFYSVSRAYYETLMLLAQKKSLIESEKSSSETLKAASLKHKLGIAVLADKLSAKASNSRDKLKLVQVDNSIKNSKSELNILLNLNPNYDLFIEEPEVRIGKTKINFKKLLNIALDNRSDLKIKLEERKIAEREIKSIRMDKFPIISAGASATIGNEESNYTNLEIKKEDKSANVSISVSVPIFSGFSNTNQIRMAKNKLKAVDVEIEELKNTISQEVWLAYNDLITSEQGFNIANETLESEAAHAKLMLGMYKNGKSSILEVLSANDTLQNAKFELINTRYNWFINRITLLRAIGKVTVENINNIEEF